MIKPGIYLVDRTAGRLVASQLMRLENTADLKTGVKLPKLRSCTRLEFGNYRFVFFKCNRSEETMSRGADHSQLAALLGEPITFLRPNESLYDSGLESINRNWNIRRARLRAGANELQHGESKHAAY